MSLILGGEVLRILFILLNEHKKNVSSLSRGFLEYTFFPFLCVSSNRKGTKNSKGGSLLFRPWHEMAPLPPPHPYV